MSYQWCLCGAKVFLCKDRKRGRRRRRGRRKRRREREEEDGRVRRRSTLGSQEHLCTKNEPSVHCLGSDVPGVRGSDCPAEKPLCSGQSPRDRALKQATSGQRSAIIFWSRNTWSSMIATRYLWLQTTWNVAGWIQMGPECEILTGFWRLGTNKQKKKR